MKKQEIEYEDVPLKENEIRESQYMLDDHKLQILTNKNKLELLQYQIDNNIPKSILRNNIVVMKEDIKEYEEKWSKLGEKDCKLSEEEKVDKKIVLMSTIKSCQQQIGEKELQIKLNLPSRDLNQVIEKVKGELNRFESNMKVYHKMIRNKTRRVPKPRLQLSEDTK